MEQNNKNNLDGVKIPAPPPVVPKKEAPKKDGSKKGGNKKLAVIIPLIAVILIAGVVATVVIIKNGKDNNDPQGLPPVIVTDNNGVPVTDAKGEPVTVVPETEVHEYTDSQGNKQTTVVYKQETVYVPVTDAKGEQVTDKNGEAVTEKIEFIPTTNKPGVVGTTMVPVTDGQGNTGRDEQGNIIVEASDITENTAVVTPADIDWKDSKGGTAADYVSSVAALKDGGTLAAIVTNSTDGNFSEYKELGYVTPYTVLVKYSKSGNVDWQEVIGSKGGMTTVTALVATDDGGFYAVGHGLNIGGETGKGYYDGFVCRFNADGKQVWKNYKIFGTSTVDLFNGAALTADGGIVVVGSVGNNDGDAGGFGKPELETAACIVKYNANGERVFRNIIGGNKDNFTGVAVNSIGEIFCVGNFYSGQLFKGLGSSDSGIVKFSAKGEYLKVFPIAGSGIESFSGITACKDGGVAVVGRSNSSDAGATSSAFVSDLASRGGFDSYIFRVDDDLNFKFAKAFRGQNDDNLVSVVEKEDGTFIAAGYSNSSSRDLKGITTRGGDDMVIACFDKFGGLKWARSFGGTRDDSATSLCLSSDGGYIVAGRTLSKDIDMKGIAQYINGKSVGIVVKFPE